MDNWTVSSFCKLACMTALFCPIACSDDPVVDAADAGFEADAMVLEDAGVRAKCPLPEHQPACTKADDCNPPGSKPSQCGFCTNYNAQVCLLGACMAPAQTGFFTLRFDTRGVAINSMTSFAGFVLTAATTGGETLTCDAVYARTVDVHDTCYNVLDVAYVRATNGVNGVYPVNFGPFASGQRVLFVVYAFPNEDATGPATGVSCTERVIADGEPGPVQVEGDNMRILQ